MFSTSFGLRSPRAAPQNAGPVIIRSDPHADAVQFAARYRQKWPLECNKIQEPVDLKAYFDDLFIHIQGADFLTSVLQVLARQNEEYRKEIANFALKWIHENPAKFEEVIDDTNSATLFSVDDQTNHDQDYLLEVLEVIKDLKKGKMPEVSNTSYQTAGESKRY